MVVRTAGLSGVPTSQLKLRMGLTMECGLTNLQFRLRPTRGMHIKKRVVRLSQYPGNHNIDITAFETFFVGQIYVGLRDYCNSTHYRDSLGLFIPDGHQR